MNRASNPGNLFLFGEHAVVYGKPAIIASVDLRVRCQIKSLPEKEIKISSRELGNAVLKRHKRDRKDLFILLDLCKDILSQFKIQKGVELKIESDIPVASGLSSSSAVLCSILSGLSKLFKLNIPNKDYYNYLIKYQRVIHGGRASGVEIISSAQGGFNYISFKPGLKIKKLGDFPFRVVIGDTGIKTKTSKTVKEFIPKLIKKRPLFTKRCFNKIEELTKEGLKSILEGDILKIGKLMTENQKILAKLGLSHPKLDRGVNVALEAGAYGAKLSGKGQGGVMLALVNKDSQKRVAKAIKRAGLKVIQTKIGVTGVK
ncbi:MAG: mevalonate kinase [Parcubacteria group bacterium CG_4_9_14_0_2_um_filter_35_11]|nr:MAG: mevalonate kinase [Parcubacteria group bacterium CG07_land_8_20_14_0_80_35_11]PJC47963.1 MAG: mevalonate kinase [Parcubacteria group bacterium CG_4_9_14_0_2_um_filter_35_11]